MNFKFQPEDDLETFQVQENLSISFGALSIRDSYLFESGKKDEIVLHSIKKINNTPVDVSSLLTLETGVTPIKTLLEEMVSHWPEEMKENIVKLALGKSLLLSLKNLDKKPSPENLQYAKELRTQAELLKSKVTEVMRHGS